MRNLRIGGTTTISAVEILCIKNVVTSDTNSFVEYAMKLEDLRELNVLKCEEFTELPVNHPDYSKDLKTLVIDFMNVKFTDEALETFQFPSTLEKAVVYADLDSPDRPKLECLFDERYNLKEITINGVKYMKLHDNTWINTHLLNWDG